MTRTVAACTTLAILAAARISDLAATFWFDPSLQSETNVFVTLFGRTSTSLLLPAVAIFALLGFGLWLYWRGPEMQLIPRPGTLWRFVASWLRAVALDRQPLGSYLSGGSHANQGLQAIRLFGLALAWAIIFGSFAAVYAWFVASGPFASHLPIVARFSVGSFSTIPALAALVGFTFGATIFFRSEFKQLLNGGS